MQESDLPQQFASGWLKRLIALLATAGALLAAGCATVEPADPSAQPVRTEQRFEINVSPIMRGTVAAEGVFLGYRPVVVRGYGFVVGLDGTGSRDIPPDVRAEMLAEMSRRGIGQESQGLGHLNAEEMLNSPNTAVVVVEAIIPPGAVQGTQFDVRVFADPRTGTTSLAGGRLYTTELRPGPLRTGSREARALAEASGPLFINPFAETSNVTKSTSIDQNSARIMNGGRVLRDMPIKLKLARPSHVRASVIQNAINARFPRERAQRDPTARGESDESIVITVPHSYHGRTRQFVQLLRHTTIRLANPESVAASLVRAIRRNPLDAEAASWRWQALGERALPIIQDLYDYPEELPRLAALRAGANLGDPNAIPFIIDIAKNGSSDSRADAIELLGRMPMQPQIDMALRELLNEEDVEIRLSAYESLLERNDPYLSRRKVDDKFVIDMIDSDKPLIYITQIGEPRIVLFGEPKVTIPCFVRTWDNRLMLNADEGDEKIELYYRPHDGAQGIIKQIEPDLSDLAYFLGHTTDVDAPKPGLGLTYAQTVGAVHAIWSQDYIDADFKAEQDRILAEILDYAQDADVQDRPEFADPDFPWLQQQGEDQTPRPGEEDDQQPFIDPTPEDDRSGNTVPR